MAARSRVCLLGKGLEPGHSLSHRVGSCGMAESVSAGGCSPAALFLLSVNGAVSYSLPGHLCQLCLHYGTVCWVSPPSPQTVPNHLCCLCQTSTCPCPHTPTASWEVTCSGCSSVGEHLWVQGCGWGATGGYLKSEGLAAQELRSCSAGLQGSVLRPIC